MKKTIVISAINLFEGGPFSILDDCIRELVHDRYEYNIKILVHSIKLVEHYQSSNIEFVQFPKSRKSYVNRLFYEFFYFYKLSKKWDVYLWLSLHDVSPFVKAEKQAVYCHNASIFRDVYFRDIYLQPTLFFFSLLYKYIYKINIKANKYLITQSSWMRDAFSDLFSISKERIIVAKPTTTIVPANIKEAFKYGKNKTFFFPAFPRPFKNFEVIGDACAILYENKITNFEVYITLDGSENIYSKLIYNKYKHLPNINFLGLLSREEVFKVYKECDVLIFPSTLESWGLPISEFKDFNKPILLVDLPYAHETLGYYQKVNFFDANNPKILADLMRKHINNDITFDGNKDLNILSPFASNWKELFQILLQDK
ncbi:glycosyltransferase [Emticicia aquatilis]|uniref:glycosyltransferase n=1 Tax=Emticicia aquatilis TaxID=1537369 RepID=UPI00166F062A|nr:glycosyltransferase [Emticicia aquatilis]